MTDTMPGRTGFGREGTVRRAAPWLLTFALVGCASTADGDPALELVPSRGKADGASSSPIGHLVPGAPAVATDLVAGEPIEFSIELGDPTTLSVVVSSGSVSHRLYGPRDRDADDDWHREVVREADEGYPIAEPGTYLLIVGTAEEDMSVSIALSTPQSLALVPDGWWTAAAVQPIVARVRDGDATPLWEQRCSEWLQLSASWPTGRFFRVSCGEPGGIPGAPELVESTGTALVTLEPPAATETSAPELVPVWDVGTVSSTIGSSDVAGGFGAWMVALEDRWWDACMAKHAEVADRFGDDLVVASCGRPAIVAEEGTDGLTYRSQPTVFVVPR